MNTLLTLTGLAICIALSNGAALTTSDQAFVVSTTALPDVSISSGNSSDNEPKIPKIYEMRVETNVSNRYATTLITSKVKNLDTKAQEATFSIVTPEKAFISSFIMEIDGKKYEAYVQEKEEAKKTYDEAISRGQSAAHVAASARDSHRFTVSVNVEPQSKAVFYLTYEELLSRRSEKYEVVLNINPGQPVKNLTVQVNVAESRPIKFVKVPSLRSGNEVSKNNPDLNPEAEIRNINETYSVVTFSPDVARQKVFGSSLGGKEEDGLSGQFVVQYDVERDPQGGEVLVDGGHFVHFFAPDDLPPLKKQVVFVLDTSGSMSGTRMTQLKEAMDSILSELKPQDLFSIVEFNSVVKVWNIPEEKVTYQIGDDTYLYYNPEPTPKPDKEKVEQVLPASIQASTENINKAKQAVKQFNAFGGTDIESALKVGLQIIAKTHEANKDHQPIIVFLTDGEPTVGQTITTKITSTITELNSHKVPIFSLSFGDGADRDFLQKISLNNQGFARHIYEAADAYLQLGDFYKQISSPLLSNVTFKYVDKITNVTRTTFPILFEGGELRIAGVYGGGFGESEVPTVEALGINGPVILKPRVYQSAGNLERLWAYLTVRQLLDQREIADDKEPPTREILKLALKYSFVTDVSSLVVVKPNASSAVDTEDASKNNNPVPFYANRNSLLPTAFSSSSMYHSLSGLSGPQPSYAPARPSFILNSPVPQPQSGGAAFAAGGIAGPLTTPAALHQEADVQFEPLMTTTEEVRTNQTLKDYLSNHVLQWLKDKVSENGTINVGLGTYPIAYNYEALPDHSPGPGCSNSQNNSAGNCTFFEQCPIMTNVLVDYDSYTKHFCEIRGFAGVCCPLASVINQVTPIP